MISTPIIASQPEKVLLDKAALFLIRFGYQKCLSPLKYKLGSRVKGCAFRRLHEQQNIILAADGRPLVDTRPCSVNIFQSIREGGVEQTLEKLPVRKRECFLSSLILKDNKMNVRYRELLLSNPGVPVSDCLAMMMEEIKLNKNHHRRGVCVWDDCGLMLCCIAAG